mmetsp:Transcript_14297/g.40607  ORF Transcript_14297/g.40607 Transcript_14297/m.40607 type:complete len:371 (+) Transcript_14297:56-1168(+)
MEKGGVLLLFVVVGSVTAAVLPKHSWDTLPVYGYFGNETGLFRGDLLAFVWDHFDWVVVPKFQGKQVAPYDECEKKIIQAGHQLKSGKPSLQVLFYMNGVMAFDMCQLHTYLWTQRKDLLLHDKNGKIVTLSDGHGQNPPVYDLGQEEMRNLWIQVVMDAVNTGDVDGVFVDRGQTNAHQFKSVGDSKTKAWNEGYREMLAEMQRRLGDDRLVVVNNKDFTDVNGRSFEKFGGDDDFSGDNFNADFRTYAAEGAAGRWVQLHGEECTEARYTRSLAAFLVGAADTGGYYACTDGWHLNTGWLDWKEDYDKPLGRPIGEANITTTNNFEIWEREFEEGVRATLHLKTPNEASKSYGCVYWSDGSVTGQDKC